MENFHLGKLENSPRYVEIFAQHFRFVGDLSTCTVAEFVVVASASDKALGMRGFVETWTLGARYSLTHNPSANAQLVGSLDGLLS